MKRRERQDTVAKHEHEWLDNYGKNLWDEFSVYLQEKNNSVWEATLNIANDSNGRKILYDIDPIKKVEGAVKSAPTSTNNKIPQDNSVVNSNSMQNSENNAKELHSDRDSHYLDLAKDSTLKITPDMPDNERAEVLKKSELKIVKIQKSIPTDVSFDDLEKSIKSTAEKILVPILKNKGILTNYTSNAVDISFNFTRKGLNKSLHSQLNYGGNFSDFAKISFNLNALLDNSVLIESHSDKAVGTSRENSRLKTVYVLLSVMQDVNALIPVQFEIKEYIDNNNRLYLAVALTKTKEVGVMDNTAVNTNQLRTSLIPTSNISISDIFEKINIQDKNFLKYIPDCFLSNEQQKAKKEAVFEEKKKYSKFSDRDSDGNTLTEEQRNYFKDSKVRDENGNLMKVYHGSPAERFTVFKRNHNYFTDNKDVAKTYTNKENIYEGYLNITNPIMIDAGGEVWSKIAIENLSINGVDNVLEFLESYGSSVWKEKGKIRTSTADIVSAISDAIDDGELNADGIIIRNIYDEGSYGDTIGKHLGTDYVTFESNQFKNADNKNPTSDKDIRYSERNYWKPNLNNSEWDLLNYRLSQEIETSDNYLDSATKWLYNESKGTKVFAIYGIGNGTEPTVLYAVGGKKAENKNKCLNSVLRGETNEAERLRTDRSTRDFIRRIENFLAKQKDGQNNNAYAGRGSSTNRDAEIYERQYGSNPGADNSRSTEDSESGVSFSERDPDALTNRQILAEALKTATQNGFEKELIEKYKSKIDFLDEQESKRKSLKAQIS